MGVYAIRRLLTGALVLLIVSMVVYLGLSLAPGDELSARLSPEVVAQLTPAQIQQQRAALGLDQPLPVRYGTWLEHAAQGDLGYSSSEGETVADSLRSHIGPTLLLVGAAMLLGTVVALALGILAAVRRHTVADYVLGALPVVLIGIPVFVLALATIYLFSVDLHLLPTNGMHTLGDDSAGDLLRHLVLPASVLSIGFAAPLLRYTRASMLDVLGSEYIVTARAKGLRERDVVLRHALRAALVPIVTVIGLYLPEMLAGAVIVEQVFGWPGLGELAVRAAGNRDISVMLGVVLFVALCVTVVNLLTDLAYAKIDPRVRLGQ